MSSFSHQPPPPEKDAPPTNCPACRSTAIVTTAKAPDAESYWRCEKCGEIWNAARSRQDHGGNRWR